MTCATMVNLNKYFMISYRIDLFKNVKSLSNKTERF